MEIVEDIVIVGAGIAGLTTSLGLHRMGLRSIVLESSERMRTTGFALTIWPNAWKALDVIGIADSLRQQYVQLDDQAYGIDAQEDEVAKIEYFDCRLVVGSTVSGLPTSQMSFKGNGKHKENEVRCVKRKALLEALEKELPPGTIRFSSKVVFIEEDGYLKLVHLADGSILRTKVLIGCDGVNSVVAKYLGFQIPVSTGRSSIRGYAEFSETHGFEPKFFQFVGDGIRFGLLPSDERAIYWFFTWTPTTQHQDIEKNPTMMKQFVLSNLGKVPKEVVGAVESTDLESIVCSPLRFRKPWNLFWADISRGNICVAGDALHPMTPDIGQGGCSALEDGVILARCLAETLLEESRTEAAKEKTEAREEYNRIKKGLEKFAKERRWRSFELISTAYVVGLIQQSGGMVMNFLRDKFLSAFMAALLLKRANYDCGELKVS